MKKITKLLVVLSALTVLFAVPVMADEQVAFSSTNTDDLIRQFNEYEGKINNDLSSYTSWIVGTGRAQTDLVNHLNQVQSQVKAAEKLGAQNHIKYLQAALANANEIVRVKQQNIASINALASDNPTLAAQQLPGAQAELANALVAQAQATDTLNAAQVKLAQYL